MTANRPASNAHLSSSAGASTGDFDLRDDADDFLGLESEVEALTGTTHAIDNSDVSLGEDGELELSEGWLLEVPVEQGQHGTGLPTTVPTAPVHHEPADEYYDEGDEFYEEDELEDEAVAPASSGPRRMAILGFCAAVVGAGALIFLRGSGTETPTEVATVPAPAPVTSTPTGGPGSETLPPTQADPEVEPATDTATEVATPEGSANPLDGLLAGGPAAGAPTIPSVDPAVGPDFGGPVTDPTAAVPDLGLGPDLSLPALDAPRASTPRTLLVRLEDGFDSGDVAELMPFQPTATGLIWTGTDVPMEAIARPGRLLTPGVGIVRATMASGELFEGNLYAVGGNRVWIELGPGRVGLDGERVQSIERIALNTDVDPESPEAIPGQRVRIRTEGGVLYGKVKTRDGDRVTIVTDKGGRITLVDPVIEPIGRVSALVLKR